VRIQNILRQYPDGGQILKELLQNAGTFESCLLLTLESDDARAKTVKFMYNHNSYGSESLFSGSMQKFQGPALYAYNSATFEEKVNLYKSTNSSVRTLTAFEILERLGRRMIWTRRGNLVLDLTLVQQHLFPKSLLSVPHYRLTKLCNWQLCRLS
jgi:hypothetical protein